MPAEPVNSTASFVEAVNTAIAELRAAADGTVRYIDMTGRVSSTPFKGINIMIDADGTVKKVVK